MSGDVSGMADTRPDRDVGGNVWDPHNLSDKFPQDVGLSPLGCGECGADEIYSHPCPECEWSPGRDEEQSTIAGWSR